jgi:hypothetical protein
MGVQFDRILEPFTGPFERVTEWNVPMPAGRVIGDAVARHYSMPLATNNSFIAANRLLANGVVVTRPNPGGATDSAPRQPIPALEVTATPQQLAPLARELGVTFTALSTAPTMPRWNLRPARVGLWDQYGGSMDAGWARWILEQFEFPFTRVFAQELDAGNLNSKFDVLVFVDGAIPAAGGGGGAGGGPQPQDVPDEYRAHLGRMTAQQTIPRLREFVEHGGTIVAIGSSAENIATHFQLPVRNHLVENGADLPRTKYYAPGSLLRAGVDRAHPLAAGAGESTIFFFDNSPVFTLGADAAQRGVRPIAWFDTATPLVSGWAWGQQYLKDGVVAAEARVGRGRVVMYGPEILKRAQPHGTFRFLFNALYTQN